MDSPDCFFNIMRKSIRDITEIELLEAADACTSRKGMLEYFGFSRNSGSMAKILSERIIENDIDISHFKLQGIGKPRYSIEDICIKNSKYTNIERLKIRLVNEGYKEYKCSICGNIGEHLNKKLVLQLDHINGICKDHRLENLRFLCPNCHSQTNTFSGKNIG